MRHYRIALAALVLAAACAGCKGKPTLVGDWTGAIQVMGTSVETEFHFGNDGKASFKQTARSQSSTQIGTYKEAEKTFDFTPTSVESPSLTKEMLTKVNEAIAKEKKTVTFDLVWKDSDHIKITQQGAPPPLNVAIELKRKSG